MNKQLQHDYDRLLEKYREIVIFSSAAGVLGWDMQTYMPPKGINLRAEQLALLTGIGHRMATDRSLGRLLSKIEQSSGFAELSDLQKRNIHLIRKGYDEQVALPEDLVTEMQRQSSIATDVWKKAKADKDWKTFLPELEKNIELTKQAAEILMQVKKTATPYDALIDIYEPKMSSRRIEVLFNDLQKGLVSLIDKIKRSPGPDMSVIERPVTVDIQRKIAKLMAEAVQYDVTSKQAGGRIDETEHPFTTGYFDDVRITTHYHEDRFASSVFSVLHEAGHALYEQDLDPEWIYQPVGSGCSTGIHESQSRIVENMVGRSKEFWSYYWPKVQEITGRTFSDVSIENFMRAVNQVVPSKIRIEADEVTYSLHVIIRFNIEKRLFAGEIAAKELPEVWNQSYQDYLGVKIENDSEGVMQDSHWSGGNFGYFPCYALGNIYDGMLLAKMEKDIPGWRKSLDGGDFTPVKDWLAKNVHCRGNLYDPPELVQRITGSEPDVVPYLKYLNEKYSRLYGFKVS